ncbi:hypothetical protein GW17_00000118 [Ensete ventricosum]|nr:hypothetical protein GW17_00000118 [Ensete ventricosum]
MADGDIASIDTNVVAWTPPTMIRSTLTVIPPASTAPLTSSPTHLTSLCICIDIDVTILVSTHIVVDAIVSMAKMVANSFGGARHRYPPMGSLMREEEQNDSGEDHGLFRNEAFEEKLTVLLNIMVVRGGEVIINAGDVADD